MLSLGLWEIVVIAVLAVVVVGPERLPRVMRYLGRQYGMLRRLADEMRRAMVLEADRQDADERYQEMQRRRDALKAQRDEAEAGGAVSQAPVLPFPVDDTDEGAAPEPEVEAARVSEHTEVQEHPRGS